MLLIGLSSPLPSFHPSPGPVFLRPSPQSALSCSALLSHREADPLSLQIQALRHLSSRWVWPKRGTSRRLGTGRWGRKRVFFLFPIGLQWHLWLYFLYGSCSHWQAWPARVQVSHHLTLGYWALVIQPPSLTLCLWCLLLLSSGMPLCSLSHNLCNQSPH